MQPSVEWVLSIPLYSGLIFFILKFRVLSLLMDIFPLAFLCLEVWKQGCPLSPLSYVLVAEILAVNIRCNPRIPGLSLPGVHLVVSPVHYYVHFIHV